ncbi:FG-GAP-like repeat-containing protein [Arthrobacter sp. NPDC056691]|uniref:FG-GAP-like repeat-containing protein n=1 Tax=Arthrobacter sp. NPDC056691 TaxID=3345913 RepID=UPI00366C10DF
MSPACARVCADAGATFRRGLGFLVAFAMVALLLVPASPAVAADEPALLSFERTSPAVLEAGGTVSFSFTTSVPVKGIQVELKDLAGREYARWLGSEGVLSGAVTLVAAADAWPSGQVQVSAIGLDLVSGIDQWYYRDGRTVPAGLTLAPSFGSLALRDFEIANPQLIFEDPRLTHLGMATEGPLTPGQTASVNFSLAQGAKEVLFVYASSVDTSQQVLTWQGTASRGPLSATASAPVTQAWTPGGYEIDYVRVIYLGGRGVTHYFRDGKVSRIPATVPVPSAALASLTGGNFIVSNPAKALKAMHNTAPPKVTGPTTTDTRLSAEPGIWDADTPESFTYQWLRNGVAVPGATYSDYNYNSSVDGGTKMSVRVTVRAPGYQPATATSAAVGPLPRYIEAQPPEVVGDSSVGGTVRVVPGYSRVIPAGGSPSYSYVWKRNGAPIPGATRGSYVLVPADKSKTITVDLTVAYDPLSKIKVAGKLRTVVANKPKARGFNADGTTDFFARDTAGNLYLYPTNGKGNWLPRQKVGVGWSGFDKLMATGDFNGDLNNDVMARDRSGRLFLYPGNGKGGWLKRSQVGVGWGGFKDVIAPGDFTGDGNNDIIARDASNRIWLYPGNGRGGWLAKSVIDTGWGEMNPIAASAKFSGTNEVDIIGRDSFGYLRLFPGNGKGQFALDAPAFHFQIGQGWGGVRRFDAAGDFNGDGDEDIWGINGAGALTMYYGNGRYVSTHGLDHSSGFKGKAVVGTGWGGFTAVF